MPEPLTSVIAGFVTTQFAKTAWDIGREKIKECFKGTPIERAIKATSALFPNVRPVEESLTNLVRSDQFAGMLEDQMSGKRAIADEELAEFLVKDCGFYTGLQRSQDDALKVLSSFLEYLRDELHRSTEGLVYLARTEEQRHRELAAGQQDRIEFDTNTPEGREAHEAFKRLLETGEPVDLTAPAINVALPEFISRALEMEFKIVEMHAHPVRGFIKIPITLTVENDSGEECSWSNIIMEDVDGGSRQKIFSNEHQGLPLKVWFIVPADSLAIDVRLGFNVDGLNVKQAVEGLRFFRAFSKGGKCKIENPETGASWGIGDIPAGFDIGMSPEFIHVLEALVFIQRKTSVLFTVPERFSADEVNTIFSTKKILETGRYGITAKDLTCNLNAVPDENFLNLIRAGKSVKFQHYADDTRAVMCGKKIFLGEALITGDFYVAPEDVAVLEEAISKPDSNGADLRIKLTPVEGSIPEAKYIDWLPKEEAEEIRNIAIVREPALRACFEIQEAAFAGRNRRNISSVVAK